MFCGCFASTCVDVLGYAPCVCGWFWVVWVPGSRVVGFALPVFPRVIID